MSLFLLLTSNMRKVVFSVRYRSFDSEGGSKHLDLREGEITVLVDDLDDLSLVPSTTDWVDVLTWVPVDCTTQFVVKVHLQVGHFNLDNFTS